MQLRIFSLLMVVVCMVYSCKKTGGSGLTPTDADIKGKNLAVMVDNSFTIDQKSIIKTMLDRYDGLQFSSNYEVYRRFFGGDSIQYLNQFINKRIKYFVPIEEEVLRKSFGNATDAIGAGYSLAWLAPVCNSEEETPYIVCNGRIIELNTSRHGVVVSGPAFFHQDTTDIERISVLAHEARHADCPEKPLSYIACSLIAAPDLVDQEDRKCGYVHAKCSDKDEARACDNLTWGSYAVSFVVLGKFYLDCDTCSEQEKQVSNLLAKIYAKRFFNDPFEGTPDLKSYDE